MARVVPIQLRLPTLYNRLFSNSRIPNAAALAELGSHVSDVAATGQ